jgi:ubiquinone/menaquinone biosynthesis C-methylase UbiE
MSSTKRLHESYDEFPRIEEEFHEVLEESLHPRGPEALYDVVATLGLRPGASVVDVGCGEGTQAAALSKRFGFNVLGVDPIPRHVDVAQEAGVSCELGRAERLPVDDDSVDLVWCRDVLTEIPDLEPVFVEMHRVLRPGGRALVYLMLTTDLLEPEEAARFHGDKLTSMDEQRVEAAIRGAALHVDERVEIGSQWGEQAEEEAGKPGRRLLWAARLMRDPDRYIERFGTRNYEIMLRDCHWHVYAMIGKLHRRAYVLSKND